MGATHPLLERAQQAGLDADCQQFARLSLSAREIYGYSSSWVPQHLQTPAYTRAAHATRQITRGWSPAETRQRTAFHAALGKEVLGNQLQRRDWYIGQAALMLQIGGPDVTRRQLEYLINLAGDPQNENIRVVPLATNEHLGLDSSTVEIYHDDSGAILREEGLTRNTFDAHPDIVRRGALVFAALNRIALGTPDSVTLMKNIAHEL